MIRRASKTLTEGELRIMDVVWSLEQASVKDVTAALKRKHPIAYKTVQTMLRILEEKGYVRHVVSGRSYIYSPIIARQVARRAALEQLLKNFFDGSPQSLLVNLVEDNELDASDIQKLSDLISKSE